MTNLYYYDAGGKRIGPVTPAQLQALAQQGRITPETTVENDEGRTTLAKNLKGVFPVTAPAGPNPFSAPMPPMDQVAVPAGAKRTSIFAALGNMGSCFALIVCWIILIGVLGAAAEALFPGSVSRFIPPWKPNTEVTTPSPTTPDSMENQAKREAEEARKLQAAQVAAQQAAREAVEFAGTAKQAAEDVTRSANAAARVAADAVRCAANPVEPVAVASIRSAADTAQKAAAAAKVAATAARTAADEAQQADNDAQKANAAAEFANSAAQARQAADEAEAAAQRSRQAAERAAKVIREAAEARDSAEQAAEYACNGGAFDLQKELQKSGFADEHRPLDSLVQYGNARLRKELNDAKTELARVDSLDDIGLAKARAKVRAVEAEIERARAEIAAKRFFSLYSYSVTGEKSEGSGSARFEMTIPTGFDDKNPQKAKPSFAEPNVSVSAGDSEYSRIRLTVAGKTANIRELTRNKNNYQAKIRFTNLRYNRESIRGSADADVLRIAIIKAR